MYDRSSAVCVPVVCTATSFQHISCLFEVLPQPYQREDKYRYEKKGKIESCLNVEAIQHPIRLRALVADPGRIVSLNKRYEILDGLGNHVAVQLGTSKQNAAQHSDGQSAPCTQAETQEQGVHTPGCYLGPEHMDTSKVTGGKPAEKG